MKNKFYTKTLASLYAKQGYYDEAEEALQNLLLDEPGRTDLIDELSSLSFKKKESKKLELLSLVSEWRQLLIKERLSEV